MAKDELVFLPLGGSGEIGMNMNLYGFGPPNRRKWIMIDCGVMFGDLSTPGVEIICADPTFILEERDNLLALILTHGHEDHIGAVALIAGYSTRLSRSGVDYDDMSQCAVRKTVEVFTDRAAALAWITRPEPT